MSTLAIIYDRAYNSGIAQPRSEIMEPFHGCILIRALIGILEENVETVIDARQKPFVVSSPPHIVQADYELLGKHDPIGQIECAISRFQIPAREGDDQPKTARALRSE